MTEEAAEKIPEGERLPCSPWQAFVLVFALHVGLQAFLLTKVPVRFVEPHTRWEVTAVAMSLYERGEFADPYAIPTGPTAHVPPFHPALIAAVYRLLGPTLRAGYVVWLLLVATHGVAWAMLPWLAGRLGLDPRAGLAAGIVGALLPRWPGFAEAPAAIAIGLMLSAFLARWEGRVTSPVSSFALGLAIGLSLLVAPSLLLVPLGLLAWEALLSRPRRGVRGVALVLFGMALACVPWTLRNERALGGLVFVRSNLGLELRMGNHDGAGANLALSARAGTEHHPRTDIDEARKVHDLGELSYMRTARHEATGWIRAHPLGFLRLTGLRVLQFWFGEIGGGAESFGVALLTLVSLFGAWRAFPSLSPAQRAAILVPLVLYPLVYYVVGYENRYRQPLDGLALIIAAGAVFPPRPAASYLGRSVRGSPVARSIAEP